MYHFAYKTDTKYTNTLMNRLTDSPLSRARGLPASTLALRPPPSRLKIPQNVPFCLQNQYKIHQFTDELTYRLTDTDEPRIY